MSSSIEQSRISSASKHSQKKRLNHNHSMGRFGTTSKKDFQRNVLSSTSILKSQLPPEKDFEVDLKLNLLSQDFMQILNLRPT